MTAPLTPERLAGIKSAWWAVVDPQLSPDLQGAAWDVLNEGMPDLLAAQEAATERAEKAEAALARVAGLVALEESTPGAVDGLLSSIREAMGGKP